MQEFPYSIPGFTDPVSSLSHLLGAGVFAVLAILLIRKGWGSPARVGFLSVFAFTCVFTLSMSGVYHLLSRGSAGRAVLQRLDHGAIFLFIAGTFTPVCGILFSGLERWGMLLFVWSTAVTAVTLKTIFFTDVPEWLGVILYLGFGWFGLAVGLILWRRYGLGFLKPLIWGALAYTAGALLEFFRWPTLIPGVLGPHDLFHLAVLAGASFHWQFVSRFACGTVPPRVRPAAATPQEVAVS